MWVENTGGGTNLYASIKLPPVVCSICAARWAPAGGDDQVIGCEQAHCQSLCVPRNCTWLLWISEQAFFSLSLSLSSLTPMRFSLCALHTHDNNPLKRWRSSTTNSSLLIRFFLSCNFFQCSFGCSSFPSWPKPCKWHPKSRFSNHPQKPFSRILFPGHTH